MVLGLLWCSVRFADWNNLKGIKDFKLSIEHQGDCQGNKYDKEVETSIKYLLANSKMNLVEKNEKGEYLGVSILTIGNERLCASHVRFNTYSYNYSENSSGVKNFYQVESYYMESIFFAGNQNDHRSQITSWVEQKTKQLVVDWMEAQK